jgi:hypothetical protein
MNIGSVVLAISAVLYLVAGLAFMFQARIPFGLSWVAYSFANMCLAYGSYKGGL